MAAQGAPIVIRDTAGWLAGDGSQIASIAPAGRLDDRDRVRPRLRAASGSRWPGPPRTARSTIAVHDGRSDWRRVAQPTIGAATRGAGASPGSR